MGRLAYHVGALVALVATALLAAPALAQSGLPPNVAASIRGAVQASRQLAARETALAQSLGNPQLAATMAHKARQRADAALTSAVVSIIAANRGLANAVISTAVAESPESRNSILAGVAASFPTLAAVPAVAMPAPLFTAPGPTPVFAPPAPAPLGRAAPPTGFAEEPRGVGQEEIIDPLEWLNRGIFVVNDTLDTLVLRPVAVIYGFITPERVKESVRNFFANLNSPVLLANDLLQLTFGDAAVTTGRFAINTTIGVLGLFEVAEDFGLEAHHADFGQTMFSYGVGQGLYVMIPIFGPSTARDAIGRLVDSVFQPTNYIVGSGVGLALSGANGLSKRESLIDALDDLRAGSLDFYAALRAAYYQDRATELGKGQVDTAATIDSLFEDVE
ncbi:MAG: VacJ family lipoprotein [Alphaproteobacteria bacterium]|nr:VacJ family lipoprotein [Alphaproteobacteria bacterium]